LARWPLEIARASVLAGAIGAAACGDDAIIDLFPDAADGARGVSNDNKCSSDGDCGSSARFCEPTSHTCVECLAGTDCGTGGLCDIRSYRCTKACTSSTDCSGGVCDLAAGLCVECTSDSQCDSAGRCLLPQSVCVRCLSDADCISDEAHRHCWLVSHECVECNSSADCSGRICT